MPSVKGLIPAKSRRVQNRINPVPARQYALEFRNADVVTDDGPKGEAACLEHHQTVASGEIVLFGGIAELRDMQLVVMAGDAAVGPRLAPR